MLTDSQHARNVAAAQAPRGATRKSGTLRAMLVDECADCGGVLTFEQNQARCIDCGSWRTRTPSRGILRLRNGRGIAYVFTPNDSAHDAHITDTRTTVRIPTRGKARQRTRSPIGKRTDIIDTDRSTYAPDGSIVRARYVQGAIANTLRVYRVSPTMLRAYAHTHSILRALACEGGIGL